MTAPVVSRPRRLAWVCWALAAVVVLVFAGLGAALRGSGTGTAQFRLGDQIALTLLGMLMAGGALLLTRPRVVADADGIQVRNILGFTTLPWAVVARIRFDDGDSWASLDLHDDDNVALLAVQANDGEQAVETVLALRRLLTASRGQT